MKRLLILSTLLLFTSCKYNEAPSMGLAKEMCSCLFIAEQSLKFCEEVTKESRILAKFEVDFHNKTVVAKGVGHRAEGRLNQDPRFGCQIYDVRKLKD